jgi:hypothetical protein
MASRVVGVRWDAFDAFEFLSSSHRFLHLPMLAIAAHQKCNFSTRPHAATPRGLFFCTTIAI